MSSSSMIGISIVKSRRIFLGGRQIGREVLAGEFDIGVETLTYPVVEGRQKALGCPRVKKAPEDPAAFTIKSHP